MVIKNQTSQKVTLEVKWKGNPANVRKSVILPKGDFVIGDGELVNKITIMENEQ